MDFLVIIGFIAGVVFLGKDLLTVFVVGGFVFFGVRAARALLKAADERGWDGRGE